MAAAQGELYVGVDVGRNKDLTVITVIEKIGLSHLVRAQLRLEDMRLPDQQKHLVQALKAPRFAQCCLDMTGLGLGLTEYTQDKVGASRVHGINFASTEPISANIKSTGRKAETVRVTEAMATDLLELYESGAIKHPYDQRMRDDMRLPEKVVSPGGRVSIAATRGRDHADHFWSVALAVRAALRRNPEFHFSRPEPTGRHSLMDRMRRRPRRRKGVIAA